MLRDICKCMLLIRPEMSRHHFKMTAVETDESPCERTWKSKVTSSEAALRCHAQLGVLRPRGALPSGEATLHGSR